MFISTLRHIAVFLVLVAAPFITRAAITINGTIILDADNTFSGTGTDGDGLIAVLYDNSTGTVVALGIIDSDGTYSITTVDGDYSLMITSVIPSIADAAELPVLNSNWAHTAEGPAYGDVLADGIINLGANSDVTLDNADFGIERLPISDNYFTIIPQPIGGDVISTDGTGDNPAPLSGSDAEDGILGAGASLIIDSVPANAILSYAGIPLSIGDVITGYDPAELEIAFTTSSTGSTSVTFWFRFLDAASLGSEASAFYTVQWDDPLPVNMTDLHAVARNNTAVLSWKTLSEMNNRGFAIQHSEDGLSWESISFVASLSADGNSDGTLQYEYVDKQPASQNYYRLQQTDLDGKVSYSNIAALTMESSVVISMYPNPVEGRLHVSGALPGYQLTITDMNGKTVDEMVAQHGTTIMDIEHLASGNYLLQVYGNGQQVQSLKVVKQ